MAKFEFELEAVLEARRRSERERQRAVADLEQQRVRLEDGIRAINRRRVEATEALRARLGEAGARGRSVVAVESVRLDANAALHDELRLRRSAVELSGVYQRLHAARAALVRAMVERKAVEMLRAKRLQAWLLGERRREDRAMDDLNVMRAGLASEAP